MTSESAVALFSEASDDRVRVVAAGDSPADRFTAFAAASTPALSRIAYLLCGDEHRAGDLVQLALERTYRAWARVEGGDPFAYARRVIATARIDGWRRTRRDVLSDPADLRPAPVPDGTRTVVDRDRLVRALRQLPEAQRRVVVLRYLLDRSEQQTADELGISTGSVKSGGSRGLARLRELLGADGTTPTSAPSSRTTPTATPTATRKGTVR
ncbi:SigE family RNA polymerase sigma factor [Isoptericola sp. NPDC019482]|uniref:SigE family RNA polymerase sigma factor n=1 Tax=Isoptericola sp. NPDC019482 TaxID=3154688 RepID=UPI00348F537D